MRGGFTAEVRRHGEEHALKLAGAVTVGWRHFQESENSIEGITVTSHSPQPRGKA
jgi:hypothetical protein